MEKYEYEENNYAVCSNKPPVIFGEVISEKHFFMTGHTKVCSVHTHGSVCLFVFEPKTVKER